MGGAQLYVLRRANYLMKKGIDIRIAVFDDKDFLLQDSFENIDILKIPELKKSPAIFSKRKLLEILITIKRFIGEDFNKLFIESHTPFLSIWGEIIANYYNSKHVIYFLNEPNLYSFSLRYYKSYFLEKLNNNELLGISSMSLSEIFRNDLNKISNNYVNVPFDISEIDEITYPNIFNEIDDDSFIIATISRLGKKYIEPLIIEITKLANQDLEKKITLIVVGNDIDRNIITFLQSKYCISSSKLSIIFPGYIYPIGKDFFNRINLFIGMGTSVINSISQKCATITIDPISSKATGILGVNNNNFAYSENGKFYELADLVSMLLKDPVFLDDCRKKGFELFQSEFSIEKTMNKLDSYFFTESLVPFDVNSFLTLKCKFIHALSTNYYSLRITIKDLTNRLLSIFQKSLF